MTTVRGKAPLELTFNPKVGADTYNQRIRVDTGCWVKQQRVLAVGHLSVGCAVELVRELRKALRAIRDDTRQRHDKAVSDAEGQL